MSKAKVNRTQKEFLKAMKEKFAEEKTGYDGDCKNCGRTDSCAMDPMPGCFTPKAPAPDLYKVIDCPICQGRGYHGSPKSFCHTCGSTGRKRVRA